MHLLFDLKIVEFKYSKLNVSGIFVQNVKPPDSCYGSADWFVSELVRNHEDRFS